MGMSFTEILIIMALALLLFGPDELPKMAKALGKGLRELRKATDDIKSTLETEMNKLDDEPKVSGTPLGTPMMLPPVVDTSDPGAARAAARFAAAGKPVPPAPTDAPAPELPPVSSETPTEQIARLAPPPGAIAREGADRPADAPRASELPGPATPGGSAT